VSPEFKRSVVISAAVHVLIVLLLVVGLDFSHVEEPPPPVEVELAMDTGQQN
jgi:membrane protein involved in colicin uptake